MDKAELGRRVTRARELAGLTQESLSRAVGLDRTAVVRLENGERKLSVPELVTIAEVLGRPLSFFVEPSTPAAVSRRAEPSSAHESTALLDVELEQLALDTRTLLAMRLLPVPQRHLEQIPRDHAAAEAMAARVRSHLGLDGPVEDLGACCEALGLVAYSAPLGEFGPDGGCIEVDHETPAVTGVAVINGDARPGRRRMTLAHELGHWLTGDAYDAGASQDAELMLFSFAVHFLAPRAAVTRTWNEQAGSRRDRALAVSATFRLSWSAAVNQLLNVDLIGSGERDDLLRDLPPRGEFLRIGLNWTDELEAPYLPPTFTASCLAGFVSARVTEERTLELLRGTLTSDELPRRDEPSIDDLRPAFLDHGG